MHKMEWVCPHSIIKGKSKPGGLFSFSLGNFNVHHSWQHLLYAIVFSLIKRFVLFQNVGLLYSLILHPVTQHLLSVYTMNEHNPEDKKYQLWSWKVVSGNTEGVWVSCVVLRKLLVAVNSWRRVNLVREAHTTVPSYQLSLTQPLPLTQTLRAAVEKKL